MARLLLAQMQPIHEAHIAHDEVPHEAYAPSPGPVMRLRRRAELLSMVWRIAQKHLKQIKKGLVV